MIGSRVWPHFDLLFWIHYINYLLLFVLLWFEFLLDALVDRGFTNHAKARDMGARKVQSSLLLRVPEGQTLVQGGLLTEGFRRFTQVLFGLFERCLGRLC